MLRSFSAACCVVVIGMLGGCAITPAAPPPTPPAAPPAAVAELAPGGKLRAAINFGNPILAAKDPATGQPRGVSVDLSRELASRLVWRWSW